MHLILLHGYLLQGTGSNIYVTNVARAWQAQGHAVTVICQERQAESLPFVDEAWICPQSMPVAPPTAGHLRVIVPDIADLLPVYVEDRYDGYQVKKIPDLTAAELEAHIDLTARALRAVARAGADRVLANHVLLSPVIARRALANLEVPYDVKVHGSAMEYALVPNPGLMPYALEGLEGADTVVVGTEYVRDRVFEVFGKPFLEAKVRIVSPGMDPDLFRPSESIQASEQRALQTIEKKIELNPNGRRVRELPNPNGLAPGELHTLLVAEGETYDQRTPDSDLLDRWPRFQPGEPIVCYFGKFLDTKGVGELLVTVPELLDRIGECRILLIGFGTYREHLEGMIQALANDDRDSFERFARAGDFVEELDFSRWFRPLSSKEVSRITLTGMLDHDCLQDLLPIASLVLVPSKRPEAFGMVAVEAMAAGILPVCSYHSGLKEVVDVVASSSPELGELMTLPRECFVDALPAKIEAALQFLYPGDFNDSTRRYQVGRQLRKIAVENFSWDGIAQRLLP